jgi:hypothetical protein
MIHQGPSWPENQITGSMKVVIAEIRPVHSYLRDLFVLLGFSLLGSIVPPTGATERDGPKHQVHYLNDSRLAAATGAVSRDIAFTMTGAKGGPQSVSVKFVDLQADRQLSMSTSPRTPGSSPTEPA